MASSDVFAEARAWAAADPDPATRDELNALLAQGEPMREALEDRFRPLTFGTAGLRGLLGAGPGRMNRLVVQRTTVAVAKELAEPERGVVIAFDGRRGSDAFAEDAVAVLTALGVPVHLFTRPTPTPVLAFAVKHLRTAAGIVITASHNPPEYNGYKLYAGDGAQIVPPMDEAIEARLRAMPLREILPWRALPDALAAGVLRYVGAEEEDAYFEAIARLRVGSGELSPVAIAYTAMHGVGDRFARRALAEAGFANVVSVPEQREPDPAFPTVRFPNPEEPGALDLVTQVAARMNADLALANDPDADRLAAVIPTRDAGYRALTGNELGLLLAAHRMAARPADSAPKRAVVSSVVSSPAMGRLAELEGVRHEETLTGFKWIARRAMELEAEGYEVLLGYEEALGYSVGTVVRDKDGISAAVHVAELAARCKAAGRTLEDELERLARQVGLYASRQVTLTRPGAAGAREIEDAMTGLRGALPGRLAGLEVVAVADYARGLRWRAEGGDPERLALPAQNMLAFALEGGSRVMVRPSGTEPKLKVYIDVTVPVAESLDAAREDANVLGARLAAEMLALLGG